jgi:hypothetical protein
MPSTTSEAPMKIAVLTRSRLSIGVFGFRMRGVRRGSPEYAVGRHGRASRDGRGRQESRERSG